MAKAQKTDLVGTVQAARILNVSEVTVWRQTREGKIPHITTADGQRNLYSTADLKKLRSK